MAAYHRRTHHVDVQLLAQLAHLNIQIVNNLHVLCQKPDRHNDHVGQRADGMKLPDAIADVGPQPRL